MWWWIPLRSLWRNRRRALLSVAVIGLGTAISLFVLGFVESSRALIQQSTVQEYANLQIASPDLWNDTGQGYEYLISPDDAARITAILTTDSAYSGSTQELQFAGLLAAGNQTQVVNVTAIAPENGVLDFRDLVTDGRGLTASDAASVVIGRSLADRLSAAVGDVVTLTATTVAGAYNASPFRIVGIYRFTSEQFEGQVLFVPLAFAQALLDTQGVDRIVVALSRIGETAPAKRRIGDALAAAALPYEPRSWDELSPFYRQLSSYFDALFGFLTLAVSVLVFFIILQVLTLAFLERTREIGTLRALGTTRGEVFRLFFTESVWLALVGSAAGIGAGLLLGLVFNAVGIEWQPPGTIEPVKLAVTLGITTAIVPFCVSLVATLLSALYPSIQASRLSVVDSLRVD
jgi:putative ABC transport system permease protein